MEFVVVGAGGVGCYIGGRLAAGGAKVVFVGRPSVLDPIAAAGLTVTDLDGFRAELRPGDVACVGSCAEAVAKIETGHDATILLTVKGPATEQAAAEIAAAFPAGTLVVSFQNGVDNVARVRSKAPQVDVVAGMVPYNLVWLGPAHVHRGTGGGALHLADTPRTRQLAPAFETSGLGLTFDADMPAVQWGKLLVNLNNPVNALSGIPLREELADRDYRRSWALLMSEGLRVLEAAKIEPARILALPASGLVHVLPLPNPVFRTAARQMAAIDPSARSSMADDLRLRRPTEIDDLCGAILRLGQTVGVPAPANAKMCGLVSNFDGTYLSGPELLAGLQA